MNDIIFRPVELDDLASICGFPENEMELFSSFPSAQYPLDVEQLKLIIKQRMASSVLEINGQVVGFSNLYDHKEGEHCFMGNVFILPEQRNQGLGEKLIRSMMVMAFDKYGFRNVNVSCFKFNEQAMRLYKRIGFVEYDYEIREDPEGVGVKLVHLQYDIFRYVRERKSGIFES
ncbi:MAG: GNAT family N-acetyltransferase [Gammaproteobacteria bacterium]|nr:GNAT family N-acetyltransferase [Gammaproteobacteria bacterium]MCW8910177.1 GNAT family N-acetyltransferase [Gammaproteobacteria bacterium]MCW9004460.1 GNAT family N-acetyltransferase [Gammaproteobacteria bacterium]MCW9056295.1 GNAT family N-acetyltransferase [Gammaproteobacteria bacterium]